MGSTLDYVSLYVSFIVDFINAVIMAWIFYKVDWPTRTSLLKKSFLFYRLIFKLVVLAGILNSLPLIIRGTTDSRELDTIREKPFWDYLYEFSYANTFFLLYVQYVVKMRYEYFRARNFETDIVYNTDKTPREILVLLAGGGGGLVILGSVYFLSFTHHADVDDNYLNLLKTIAIKLGVGGLLVFHSIGTAKNFKKSLKTRTILYQNQKHSLRRLPYVQGMIVLFITDLFIIINIALLAFSLQFDWYPAVSNALLPVSSSLMSISVTIDTILISKETRKSLLFRLLCQCTLKVKIGIAPTQQVSTIAVIPAGAPHHRAASLFQT